jgi:hypothetical protein
LILAENMDTAYRRIFGVCTRTDGLILRKNMGWQCVRCQKMATTSLRAAKASKSSPKKPQKQPLEYKYV